MAGLNVKNVDDLSGYSDIVRYCKKCKVGKKLIAENYGYKLTDLFKRDDVCVNCRNAEKMDKI